MLLYFTALAAALVIFAAIVLGYRFCFGCLFPGFLIALYKEVILQAFTLGYLVEFGKDGYQYEEEEPVDDEDSCNDLARNETRQEHG